MYIYIHISKRHTNKLVALEMKCLMFCLSQADSLSLSLSLPPSLVSSPVSVRCSHYPPLNLSKPTSTFQHNI